VPLSEAHGRVLAVDLIALTDLPPFDRAAVDELDELDVPAYKIASFELVDLPFLEYVGSTGRPVILSTGMATLGEVEAAIAVLRAADAGPIALLHCVSIYPPDPDDVNLLNIPTLERAFALPVGFSDHTIGIALPLAAVALGACIVEKHFTLDKEMEGWDHAISADPAELAALVREAALVHRGLGSPVRSVSAAELSKRTKFRRRIVLKDALPAGHVLRLEDLDFKRPGNGIAPDQYDLVVGRRLAAGLDADHELEWRDLA
jgi:N-acetylneuraminate synthase